MKPPGMIPRRIGFVAALQCSRGSMNSPPPAAKLALPERFEICKAGWLDSRGLYAPPLALPHLGCTFSCPKVSGGAFRGRSPTQCFQRCLSPNRKKCFQRSFSRFPLFLKPSAPCVGFCRPGKRRCEYSSELVFSFSFSFLSKAERAWPRLLAFSRRCCRAPFSRPGQRVHSDSACFGATAYFSESRECVPA